MGSSWSHIADAGGVPPAEPPCPTFRRHPCRRLPPPEDTGPPWSVLLYLLVFSVNADRASAARAAGTLSSLRVRCLPEGSPPHYGGWRKSAAGRLFGGVGAQPLRLQLERC